MVNFCMKSAKEYVDVEYSTSIDLIISSFATKYWLFINHLKIFFALFIKKMLFKNIQNPFGVLQALIHVFIHV